MRCDLIVTTISNNEEDGKDISHLSTSTNANKEENIVKRKLSISDYLQGPLTPKRISAHRNYKQGQYAVLTARERLAELKIIEEQKLHKQEQILRRKQEMVEKKIKAQQSLEEAREKRRLERVTKQEEKLKQAAEKSAEKEQRIRNRIKEKAKKDTTNKAKKGNVQK